MLKRFALVLLLTTAIASCSDTTDADPDDVASACVGGKCDAFAPRALGLTPTDFGTCTVSPDTEAPSDFFARDQTTCTFVNFENELPLQLDSVVVEARELVNERYHSHRFEHEELDGTERRAFNLNFESYPLILNVRPIVVLDQTSGRVTEPSKSSTYLLPEITAEVSERPSEPATHTFALPFKMVEIAFWPTKEFAARFESEDLRFSYIRMYSDIQIEDTSKRHSHSRHVRSIDELVLLGNTIFDLAVEENGTATVELNLGADSAAGTATISGPGYYLIEGDGSLTEATPADIEARGFFLDDAEPPAAEDDPTVDGEEPPVTDPVDPEPTEDPCDGACDAAHACVNAECVPLEDQRQTSCRSSATAVCEKDADCYEGNVCAGGVCRLRECQFQSSRCSDPTKVCEQDTDCAEDHACAENLCRRLTCQFQSSRCSDSTKVCEQDTDCAEGHACVENLCRRLTCQFQSSRCRDATRICAGDDDCAEGHACVENLCRRLTCQTQSSRCRDATRVCEQDDDCASGHICEDSLCTRTTCID